MGLLHQQLEAVTGKSPLQQDYLHHDGSQS